LPPFTRVRVTRCRGLKAFMPDFAVLYSRKCRSLPALDLRSAPGPTQIWLDPSGARHTTIARRRD